MGALRSAPTVIMGKENSEDCTTRNGCGHGPNCCELRHGEISMPNSQTNPPQNEIGSDHSYDGGHTAGGSQDQARFPIPQNQAEGKSSTHHNAQYAQA